MTSDERTPQERTAFLMDRIERMLGALPSSFSDPEHARLRSDICLAFKKAEERGERRGMLKGAALAKLTPEERAALGLS